MQLWNDYEGATLAGKWTLGRLLRTEGRSASFSTTNPDGRAAVIRITEALNDQAITQARYRAIRAAGSQYLVAMEEFGDAELDGTPLSYAVLEPTQESLAEVLAGRNLGPDETNEVAVNVTNALQALHKQGLVHGHVEAQSVLAAGDQIKLRSECARWVPRVEDENEEGAVTAKTDALGLAGLVHMALTRKPLLDAQDALALPEPFATIVRNTLRSGWGVPEIHAELERWNRTRKPAVAPVQTPVKAAAPTAEALSAATPASPSGSVPAEKTETDNAWNPEKSSGAGKRAGILAAILVVLVLLGIVWMHHGSSAGTQPANNSDTATAPAPAPALPAVQAPAPVAKASPAGSAGPVNKATAAPAAQPPADGEVWRVVAFTYNHREQAQGKVDALNQRFPGYNAQVWSKTGSKPFLVTLGGELSRRDAFTLRVKARRAGVARDVYAQNYSH